LPIVRISTRISNLALAFLLGACASQSLTPQATSASGTGRQDLACTLPSNCVNSLGAGSLAPLRYTGTPAQALTILQATLTTFPEAQVARSEPLALEVIFTTPIGFRDQVDFRIDAQALRIDFRSRSLFGLFDWGKNHSRMQEFAIRFEQQSRRQLR
jgi:uncharacterized protein (DUF1499 family)